jgi:hypothetical protein
MKKENLTYGVNKYGKELKYVYLEISALRIPWSHTNVTVILPAICL